VEDGKRIVGSSGNGFLLDRMHSQASIFKVYKVVGSFLRRESISVQFLVIGIKESMCFSGRCWDRRPRLCSENSSFPKV
jgi:hypothetical protein